MAQINVATMGDKENEGKQDESSNSDETTEIKPKKTKKSKRSKNTRKRTKKAAESSAEKSDSKNEEEKSETKPKCAKRTKKSKRTRKGKRTKKTEVSVENENKEKNGSPTSANGSSEFSGSRKKSSRKAADVLSESTDQEACTSSSKEQSEAKPKRTKKSKRSRKGKRTKKTENVSVENENKENVSPTSSSSEVYSRRKRRTKKSKRSRRKTSATRNVKTVAVSETDDDDDIDEFSKLILKLASEDEHATEILSAFVPPDSKIFAQFAPSNKSTDVRIKRKAVSIVSQLAGQSSKNPPKPNESNEEIVNASSSSSSASQSKISSSLNPSSQTRCPSRSQCLVTSNPSCSSLATPGSSSSAALENRQILSATAKSYMESKELPDGAANDEQAAVFLADLENKYGDQLTDADVDYVLGLLSGDETNEEEKEMLLMTQSCVETEHDKPEIYDDDLQEKQSKSSKMVRGSSEVKLPGRLRHSKKQTSSKRNAGYNIEGKGRKTQSLSEQYFQKKSEERSDDAKTWPCTKGSKKDPNEKEAETTKVDPSGKSDSLSSKISPSLPDKKSADDASLKIALVPNKKPREKEDDDDSSKSE